MTIALLLVDLREEGLNGIVAFTVNGLNFGFFTANG